MPAAGSVRVEDPRSGYLCRAGHEALPAVRWYRPCGRGRLSVWGVADRGAPALRVDAVFPEVAGDGG